MGAGSRKAVDHGFKESNTKNCHTVSQRVKDINCLSVDKNTKVSENSKQFTVPCTDLGKFVDPALQKKSLENTKSLLFKVKIDNAFGHLFMDIIIIISKNF